MKREEISTSEVLLALDGACNQVERNLPNFTYRCQNHSSVNNFYAPCDNNQWTCGFWPGEICLAYEYTHNEVFIHAAQIQVESFLYRIKNKIEVDHHDMGFLYSLSCVSVYKLTGNSHARKAALIAADQLVSRFQPIGNFIQAWGEMGARENYRYIIDCLLNLPLLYWAGEETQRGIYRDIAIKHTQTCLANSFRPDGSTFHTFFMDPESGSPVRGETCQGYSADSSWARGQAWGIYGLALSYRYTKDSQCIALFRKATDYYLSRLPEDLIPYWDLIFTSGDEERDSSSASIVACGLLEMSSFLEKEEAEKYICLARQMIKSLYDSYRVVDHNESNGLVLHGTYSKKSPYNTCTPEGVDECVSWGDYFYLEALTRLRGPWELYW